MDVLAFSSEHKSSAYLQGKSKLMSVCPHFSPLYSTGELLKKQTPPKKRTHPPGLNHNIFSMRTSFYVISASGKKRKLLHHWNQSGNCCLTKILDIVPARQKLTGQLSVSPRLLACPKSPPESILLD